MKLFKKTKDNIFHSISKKHFGSDNLEKTLEDWLEANPHLLGNDILLIGRQVRTDHGIIDLLALDSKGNIVVIELKRGRAPREVVGQLNSYLTIAASWPESELIRNANFIPYSRKTNNLIKKFEEHFKCSDVPEFNSRQIGVVVAEEFESDFVPQIGGLRFECHVLQFSNFVDQAGEEYLFINTLHDSDTEGDLEKNGDDKPKETEHPQVPEEIRTRFYKLADAVHDLVKNEFCTDSDGWRVHKSTSFVQAVFSCWKTGYEGISLYYEPETGKQYLATNCLPKHNRILSARLKENKEEIEAALGKDIRWEISDWESLYEYISDDPVEIAERIKAYVRTLKPYLDKALPQKSSTKSFEDPKTEKISRENLILPILRVLVEHKGKVSRKQIKEELHKRFTRIFEQPWYKRESGQFQHKWQHEIEWANTNATKERLLKIASRGVLEITDKGQKYYEENK
ncbi:MAG: DUF91 domain-containing protein [Elusimicrobia bacterium]|nr:DUF91 domain-containing protein [Elusimicrobiota bacterium]